MRLLNKVAIVTGANSGMGMATARALLDEGATVIMLCRNEKRGKEAYSKLTADGNSRTYLILCDLGDYKSIRSFVKQVKERFNVIKAYSQSKLANVLFTRELAGRVADKGITVNCCHPGAVATNIGIDRETGFGKTVTGILKPFFQTPEEGARTAIFLATDDSVKDISGEYFYKCRIAKSSKRSKDMELAKKLYEFTEELIK